MVKSHSQRKRESQPPKKRKQKKKKKPEGEEEMVGAALWITKMRLARCQKLEKTLNTWVI